MPGVRVGQHYNLKGPASGPRDYRGVDHSYAGTANSPDYYLNFGSYKIGNTADYIADLANRYSNTKNDPIHRITIGLELLEREPTLSRTAANVHELQDMTQSLIEIHIDNSQGIIPVRTGGPGAHGEVRQLNTIVALYPGQAERILSNTTMFTEKLIGVGAHQDFVACFNCSGIIPDTVNILTNRTPMNYAAYGARLRQINGPNP